MHLRNRIALLIGQLIILGFSLAYVQAVYINNIRPDLDAKENFTQTDCFLATKKMATEGSFIELYRADFLVSYNVRGVQYSRWVSGNGLDLSYSNNLSAQEALLSQYDTGGTYTCWYDPNNPEIVILAMRQRWLSSSPGAISALIALIIFYYLIRNIIQLVGATTPSNNQVSKRRNKK